MRAIVLSEFGPPDRLVLRDVPSPSAVDGQVLVDVEFANITFVETQVRAGNPPNPAMLPTLPVIPGNGVGGTVVELGPGVTPGLLGARAVTSTGGSGGYAEQVAVAAAGLVLVPEALGMAEAVALLADGRTAALLTEAIGLDAGETVLVEAAGGGVGSLLVQLARNRGARVVAAAGDDRKLGLARELGAELTVNYREAGWSEQVRTRLGDGVDVAFDGVGGEIGRRAFELVRAGGRYAPFGMASGAFTEFTDDEANSRLVKVVRLPPPAPATTLEATRWVLSEAAAGRLQPVIGQRYPLAHAAQAHAAIEGRSTVGKTLLVVAGDAESSDRLRQGNRFQSAPDPAGGCGPVGRR